MSVIKATLYTMTTIIGLIISYFLFSPVYYTMLDELNTVAEGEDLGAEATSLLDMAYGVFFYGLSSLIVLGVLATIYWLYMYMRRTYFATEEYYV